MRQQVESRGDLLLHNESDGNGHVLSDPEGGDQIRRITSLRTSSSRSKLFLPGGTSSHLTVVGTLTGMLTSSRLSIRASVRHVYDINTMTRLNVNGTERTGSENRSVCVDSGNLTASSSDSFPSSKSDDPG